MRKPKKSPPQKVLGSKVHDDLPKKKGEAAQEIYGEGSIGIFLGQAVGGQVARDVPVDEIGRTLDLIRNLTTQDSYALNLNLFTKLSDIDFS